MEHMAKTKSKGDGPKPVPPSRLKLKYVPFPKDLWDELKELGKADERSVAYMLRQAAKDFIERANGKK